MKAEVPRQKNQREEVLVDDAEGNEGNVAVSSSGRSRMHRRVAARNGARIWERMRTKNKNHSEGRKGKKTARRRKEREREREREMAQRSQRKAENNGK